MEFYKNRVYPSLVSLLGNPEPARALREKIIPIAHGTVLEIGVGAGATSPTTIGPRLNASTLSNPILEWCAWRPRDEPRCLWTSSF